MRLSLFALAGVAAGLPGLAAAQTPRISIGTIASEQACTSYVLSAGRSSMSANAYSVSAAASWRTWLQRDCVDNFATIRATLAAALASSGRLAVLPRGGGGYVLSAVVSEVGSRSSTVAGADFAVASENAVVTMSLTLRDPAGRTVGGGLVTQTLETGSSIGTDGISTGGGEGGRTLYAQLEQGLARRAARFVAFKVAPMRVIGGGPDGIQLDYGAPLLTLGTAIQVQTPDGRFGRYRVVAAGQGVANAEPDGDAFPVPPGSLATVVEEDDPAANARTMRRVDLP